MTPGDAHSHDNGRTPDDGGSHDDDRPHGDGPDGSDGLQRDDGPPSDVGSRSDGGSYGDGGAHGAHSQHCDNGSHGAEHFQRLYEASADPWGFRTSAYEREKYQRTMEALNGRRFRRAFEAGCSIGVLTRRLAECCDALLGVDIVEAPLASARETCADMPWVQFQCMDVVAGWPAGTFDLMGTVGGALLPEPRGDCAGCATGDRKLDAGWGGGAGELAWAGR